MRAQFSVIGGNGGLPAKVSGVFVDSEQLLGKGDSTYVVALGDVDGDADLDLVTGNSGQANRVYLNQ